MFPFEEMMRLLAMSTQELYQYTLALGDTPQDRDLFWYCCGILDAKSKYTLGLRPVAEARDRAGALAILKKLEMPNAASSSEAHPEAGPRDS